VSGFPAAIYHSHPIPSRLESLSHKRKFKAFSHRKEAEKSLQPIEAEKPLPQRKHDHTLNLIPAIPVRIVMKILDQTRPDRIIKAVPDHFQQHLILSNGMIMILAVPHRPLPVEESVNAPGGKSLKPLHYLSQGFRDKAGYHMHMIGHDDCGFQ